MLPASSPARQYRSIRRDRLFRFRLRGLHGGDAPQQVHLAAGFAEPGGRPRAAAPMEVVCPAGLYFNALSGFPPLHAWPAVVRRGKPGGQPGRCRRIVRNPEHGLSVALLCNAANANPAGALRAVDAVLGDRLRDEAPAPAAAVPMEAAELERRAGMYRNRRTGAPLRLVMADGRLRAGNTELVTVGPAAFRLGSARVEFADGPAAGVRLVFPEGDTMVFESAPPADTTAANLASYAGEYRSDEAEAAYTVAVENGTVMLRMRPSTAFRLVPLYADGFAGPGGAVVRFIRGADGRVEAFTITVERVRGLRFGRVR